MCTGKSKRLRSRLLLTVAGLLATVTGMVREARSAEQLAPIDVRQIEVGGQIGHRIDITVENNLLVIDVDNDFLRPFKERRSKPGNAYIGMGKLIDALVRFAAYTGDERVLARKKHVLSEIIKTQEPDGYIGVFAPEHRMWRRWDLHEMSYIVYGLVSDYEYFGEKASLEAARKLMDFVIARWSAEPQRQPLLEFVATIGFGRALLGLYQQTGDRRYLDYCVKDWKLPEWNLGIVLGRSHQTSHAYSYKARCLAQLQLYRIQPDERLLGQTRRAVDFLTRQDGLLIIGNCNRLESWHDTQVGTMMTSETCSAAYIIRLMNQLLRLEGDSQYGDLMERTIYNALFAAQSPDGRRIRHFCPFEGPRIYRKIDTYCCPNNYRRIIAELPAMIYYRSEGGLAINLYTPSLAKIELEGGLSLGVRQETDYPNSGRVAIHIDPSKPAEFSLRLRIPRWCPEANVSVNDRPIEKAIPGGSFFEVKRQWKAGDRVELQMPMPWRLVKGRKAQVGRVAVMRGPLVFCLNRARHKELADMDLRLVRLVPSSLEGPIKDDTVRPDGLACRVGAYGPGSWCSGKPDLNLVLTEFPDPGGEATYFYLPNPNADGFVDDELIQGI